VTPALSHFGKGSSGPFGAGTGSRSGSLIHPQALMAIKNLELRAKVVVEGFWNGLHRSPYHGFSVEFTEYRQYSPGDDLRDAVGLLTFDEQIRDYLPARHRAGHLRHLMLALEKPGGGAATDLTAPLKRIVQIVNKRGLMVLISDLLAPIQTLEKNLASLVACGHEVLLFHLLDPAELTFHFERATLFLDIESGRDLYIDPAAARKDYLKKLAAHNDGVRAACDNLGIKYHRLATDQPLELALFDFLRSRAARRGKVKRGLPTRAKK
jgi:uncharacterized protein (DUF58 family)